MQTSHSFLDVFQQYFAGCVLLPVFVLAIIWLYRKWNREKKIALFAIGCMSILTLYNGITYQLADKVGESSTYYRFFWICPIALVISGMLVEIVFLVKRPQRLLLLGTTFVMMFLFSSRPITNWTNLPENIYQLDTDVIQVADTLMELTGGEPTTLLDNGEISQTIRQYNAKINFTEMETYYINHILYTDNVNYQGRVVQQYLTGNWSQYISIPKNAVTRWKAIETGGIKRAAETDNYYLYAVDYEVFDRDADLLKSLETDLYDIINVEYLPISGLEQDYEFIYISDLATEETEENCRRAIDMINGLNTDAVVINSRLSENADWVVEHEGVLENLKVPYYCNDKGIQTIDCDEFLVCLIDNTEAVGNEILEQFEEVKAKGKPMVVILSSYLSEEDKSGLYTAITAEESPVVQVLSAKKDGSKKNLLNNEILQYMTPVDGESIFNIVRVSCLEQQ